MELVLVCKIRRGKLSPAARERSREIQCAENPRMEKYRENTAYPAIGFPHDRSISGITGVPGALCRL
jgi:hypothetical protein